MTTDAELLQRLIESAIRAPSPLNCQPWRFEICDGSLHVIDPHRALLPLDIDRHATLLSFGAALENVAIAARHEGRSATIRCFPEPGNHYFVAEIAIERSVAPEPDPLAPAIAVRRSSSAPYQRRRLDDAAVAAMASVIESDPRLRLHVADTPYAKRELADLLIQTERIVWQQPAIRRALLDRMAAGDLTLGPIAGSVWRGWLLATLLRRPWRHRVNSYRLLRTITRRKILLRTSHLAAVSVDECAPAVYLDAGRAIQRMWLDLALRDVMLQPLGDVIGLMMMYSWKASSLLTDRSSMTLRSITERFHRLFDLPFGRTALFLFRAGFAAADVAPSPAPRRPLGSFLGPRLMELLEDDQAG